MPTICCPIAPTSSWEASSSCVAVHGLRHGSVSKSICSALASRSSLITICLRTIPPPIEWRSSRSSLRIGLTVCHLRYAMPTRLSSRARAKKPTRYSPKCLSPTAIPFQPTAISARAFSISSAHLISIPICSICYALRGNTSKHYK